MKLSESIKPISCLKAHASEIIRDIEGSDKTLVITQNGDAKAVLQDIKKYEKMQESIAMLKLLAQSNKELQEGKYQSVDEAFADIEKSIEQESFK
ncbi:MAG: type II toxin-antitoxin system Phd/YefM family antitoxin [Fidelibacterota bacterium]